MTPQSLPLETITPEAFARFGVVIDWTAALDETGKPFHVLLRSEAPTGWRLAVSKVGRRAVQRLGSHPDTWELFAPLAGSAVLVVAEPGPLREETPHAFVLDRPACVAPNVWHGTFALSENAVLLIAENLEVSSASADLSRAVGPHLA